MSLKLDWCSHAAATWAVENWHYSGRMPAGKMVRIGAWEDGAFIGAVIFSQGGNMTEARLAPRAMPYPKRSALVAVGGPAPKPADVQPDPGAPK